MARTYTDADVVRFVTENYIHTHDHIFTTDVAKHFGTSASAMGRVMSSINEGSRFMVFATFKADRWAGDSFSGGNRPATAWEPTTWTVVKHFKGDDHMTRQARKAAEKKRGGVCPRCGNWTDNPADHSRAMGHVGMCEDCGDALVHEAEVDHARFDGGALSENH